MAWSSRAHTNIGRFRCWTVLLPMVLIACGGGGQSPPDAVAHDAPRVDGAISPQLDAHVGQATALTHTLYINTEGVAIAPGLDDAITNKSSVVAAAQTLKPWLMTDAARLTKITNLVTEVQAILLPYDVAIVTTRPASGSYDMLVITDNTSASVGLPAGAGGTTPATCNATPAVVSFLFGPSYSSSPDLTVRHTFATLAVAMFAIEAGIPGSNVAQDCMCYAGASCPATLTAPCTIGGAGIAIDSLLPCAATGTTMNEGAAFLAAYGPHP